MKRPFKLLLFLSVGQIESEPQKSKNSFSFEIQALYLILKKQCGQVGAAEKSLIANSFYVFIRKVAPQSISDDQLFEYSRIVFNSIVQLADSDDVKTEEFKEVELMCQLTHEVLDKPVKVNGIEESYSENVNLFFFVTFCLCLQFFHLI